MRIGPFGHWEILLILFVVLLLFGGKRLPAMAKGIGQSVREFRRGIRDNGDDVTRDEEASSNTAESQAYSATSDRAERG